MVERALVIAEHNNELLNNSTRSILTAAKKLTTKIDVLIIGYNCVKVAEQAQKISGISKIILIDNKVYQGFLAENISEVIKELIVNKSQNSGENNYKYILCSSNTFGKNFIPRVASLLNVPQISDIIEIIDNQTFKRPIYAGNVIETVKINVKENQPVLITIRPTAFDKIESIKEPAENSVEITKQDIIKNLQISEYIKQEHVTSSRPDLSSARIIVAGGRGLQSRENFKIIEDLADTLKAAIGASRAAVDAGFVPNEYQVGQTGKIVAPELYIAIGISGAIQHIAGMKDSKIIVVINKDEDAPIFDIADYGIVGDLFTIIPELMKILTGEN